MRVLIDVTALMTREPTGIGVYVQNLVSHLSGMADVTGIWYAEKFRKRNFLTGRVSVPLRPYVRFLSAVNFQHVDVFHGPDFRIPASRFLKKVVTIHDLVDYESTIIDSDRARRGMQRFERMLFHRRPDRIIAVSDFTRTSLLERFPQLAPITTTVYLGVDHLKANAMTRSTKRPFPYFLFVGTIDKRKNIVTLVDAFERAKAVRKDIHLVIVGNNGYCHEEVDRRVERSPARQDVHRTGFVSDQQVSELYCHAVALVYPSLYEGFGIPILEAMALGCPVITSNVGAMREVSGEAALHVDPLDAEEISQRMIDLYDDSKERTRLAAAGKQRSEQFRWKKCAEQTVEVYKSLVHERSLA